MLDKVELFRDQQGMSIKDLCRKVSIGPRYYHYLLDGKKIPSLSLVLDLIKAVGLKIGLLV